VCLLLAETRDGTGAGFLTRLDPMAFDPAT